MTNKLKCIYIEVSLLWSIQLNTIFKTICFAQLLIHLTPYIFLTLSTHFSFTFLHSLENYSSTYFDHLWHILLTTFIAISIYSFSPLYPLSLSYFSLAYSILYLHSLHRKHTYIVPYFLECIGLCETSWRSKLNFHIHTSSLAKHLVYYY